MRCTACRFFLAGSQALGKDTNAETKLSATSSLNFDLEKLAVKHRLTLKIQSPGSTLERAHMQNTDFETLAADRATALILIRYGGLGDLPQELAQVVWITVYRACAIGLKVENGGGASAITKSMLVGGGHDARELQERTLQMKFLQQIVPIIRAANPTDRRADVQLAVDVLKWNIIDAADMSGIRRMIARKLARADPMYNQPIPQGLAG
jgi:hypothetical protein